MLIDCIIIDGIGRILDSDIRIRDFHGERQRHSIKLVSAESLELISQQTPCFYLVASI